MGGRGGIRKHGVIGRDGVVRSGVGAYIFMHGGGAFPRKECFGFGWGPSGALYSVFLRCEWMDGYSYGVSGGALELKGCVASQPTYWRGGLRGLDGGMRRRFSA